MNEQMNSIHFISLKSFSRFPMSSVNHFPFFQGTTLPLFTLVMIWSPQNLHLFHTILHDLFTQVLWVGDLSFLPCFLHDQKNTLYFRYQFSSLWFQEVLPDLQNRLRQSLSTPCFPLRQYLPSLTIIAAKQIHVFYQEHKIIESIQQELGFKWDIIQKLGSYWHKKYLRMMSRKH